jgi:hypothetical protein
MAKEDKGYEEGGVALVGCTLLGVGVGMLLSLQMGSWSYTGAGAVIGLGIGFVVMGSMRFKAHK